MGWGCALLGHAEARVQKAISDALDSAAVVPFPHPLEIAVAHRLTEDIPCAEMVVFGKHGADVCTVAARLARVCTSKKIILYRG
jgi:glutamate-1-semialdehyde aminotransferase